MQGLARRAEQTVMRAVLAIAREKFAADLHMDASIFDQPAWDVSGLRDRGTIRPQLCTVPDAAPRG